MEPVDVLDLIEVLEHVPVGYRANLNAELFRVIGESLKNLAIFPQNDQILTSGALEASVEDSITRRTAYLFQGCKASTNSFNFSARALVTTSMAMVAIRVLDESNI